MRLLNVFRRKVFLPWVVLGIVFAALIIFLLSLIGAEAAVVVAMLAGLFALGFVISTIRALSGWGTKGYRKYIETLSLGEQEILYDQYKEGYRFYKAVLTENCIILLNMRTLDAMPYEGILWIYEEQLGNANSRTSSGYGNRIMAVGTDDKKIHQIPMRQKDSKHLREFLDRILERNRGIVLGYDERTAELFRKDVGQLAEQVRQRREAYDHLDLYGEPARPLSPIPETHPAAITVEGETLPTELADTPKAGPAEQAE